MTLSPQENSERRSTLACPNHPQHMVPPASVCPYCRWPEEAGAACKHTSRKVLHMADGMVDFECTLCGAESPLFRTHNAVFKGLSKDDLVVALSRRIKYTPPEQQGVQKQLRKLTKTELMRRLLISGFIPHAYRTGDL